jgi:hypothetical protein
MVFLAGRIAKVFVGGKNVRRKRGVPSRKQVNRLAVEQLEPRVLLSGNTTDDGAACSLCNLTAPALLAGADQLAENGPALAPSGVNAGSTKAPTAPLLTAKAVSFTEIDLSWFRVSGASGYLVDEQIGGAWSQIGSFDSTVASDAVTGLSPGTAYSFKVAAFNSAGTTWSSPKSATTPKPQPPSAPMLTATSVSSTQINLSWRSVSGASGYLVDQQINGAWSQIGSFDGTVTSDAVTGLSPSTTYNFKVGAFNSAGTSWSTSKSAKTGTPPAAPSFTATAFSASQINLAWTRVTGATGYAVAEWINGAWSQIGSFGSTVTSDAVTGLSPGTTYSFIVGASNSQGTSWANSRSATTGIAVDHPQAAKAYSLVSGSLFGSNGPSYLDVEQGYLGDCWLMAGLAEVAARDPVDIRNMFTAAGTTVENGTVVSLYTVRFFNNAGVAQYVTVDTELPSGGTYYDNVANGVLWAALAEKAYAQANGAGIVTTGSPGSDSYDALESGDPVWSLRAITGRPAGDYSINPANIVNAWNAGQLVVLGTTNPVSSYIVPGHAYAMVDYNASNNLPFEIYNPWGTDSSGWALGTYNGHKVYGLFVASSPFVSDNFSSQTFGSGAVPGAQCLAHGWQQTAGLWDANSSAWSASTQHHAIDLVMAAADQWMVA